MAPFNLNLPEIRLWLPFDQKVQILLSVVSLGGIAAYAYFAVVIPESTKLQEARAKLQESKRQYDLLVQSAQTIEDQKRSIRKNLARISFFDLQEDPLPDLTARNRAMVFLYQVADLAQVTGNKIVDMQIGEGQSTAGAPTDPNMRNAAAGAAMATNALANPGAAISGNTGNPNQPAQTPDNAPVEAIKLMPISVTLQVRGTYPALKDFLQAVRDLSPLVQLESFSAQMKKASSTLNGPASQANSGSPAVGNSRGQEPQDSSSAAPNEDDGPFNTLDSQLMFKVNFLQKGGT